MVVFASEAGGDGLQRPLPRSLCGSGAGRGLSSRSDGRGGFECWRWATFPFTTSYLTYEKDGNDLIQMNYRRKILCISVYLYLILSLSFIIIYICLMSLIL